MHFLYITPVFTSYSPHPTTPSIHFLYPPSFHFLYPHVYTSYTTFFPLSKPPCIHFLYHPFSTFSTPMYSLPIPPSFHFLYPYPTPRSIYILYILLLLLWTTPFQFLLNNKWMQIKYWNKRTIKWMHEWK